MILKMIDQFGELLHVGIQMTEFRQGAYIVLQNLSQSSIALALIYTFGHVIIAMSVVSIMTGASLWEAGLVALIEPSINGVWFYVLHKIYTLFKKRISVNDCTAGSNPARQGSTP